MNPYKPNLSLSVALGLFLLFACQKPEKKMYILTGSISNITANTASAKAEIVDLGVSANQCGHCYGKTPNVTIEDSKTQFAVITGTTSFTSNLSNLQLGTKYYINSYITNGKETIYGKETSFTTVNLPIVGTKSVSKVISTTASVAGWVTGEGGAAVTSRGICWSTHSVPAITESITKDGAGMGAFMSRIIGLISDTKYYVRAYATNIAGTAYGSEFNFTTNPIISDIDGNSYGSVKIGTQLWIAENLKTTKYNNGDLIGTTTPPDLFLVSQAPYQWAYDGNESNVATYGRLYNWEAVNSVSNLCPTGWHAPTDSEWTIMIDFLGGISRAGGELQETTSTYWTSSYQSPTNETGFSAVAAGNRGYDGGFYSIESAAGFWSSTADSTYWAWNRTIDIAHGSISRQSLNKNFGYSVRCISNN